MSLSGLVGFPRPRPPTLGWMAERRSPSDPVRELERQLAELEGEDERLAQDLEATREARRKLAGRIRALRASLSMVRDGGQGYTAELQGGTMADAIAVLLEHHGEMRAQAMAAALQDAGKLLRTDSAYSSLFKTLARDHRFEKVPGRRGYWKLS